MKAKRLLSASVTGLLALNASASAFAAPKVAAAAGGIDQIDTVVVIYAENRSFDNLYGSFPGADGLKQASPTSLKQIDRDGQALAELPPTWDGLTAKGVVPPVTQELTAHMPNQPFAIDDPKGLDTKINVVTHDLWHRFYQNQMQIDGGKNDKFVAYADAGGEVMGYYTVGKKLPMWKIAQKYTLADHFFMGGFGGSFFNHFELICACAPVYPNADKSPAKDSISAVEADGFTLKIADNSPKSAIGGIPKFVKDGNITPDFYAVNTMQPPYQPSNNKPAAGGDPALADPAIATTLPPQTMQNIGDLLSAKGVSWAWYSGAWQAALDGKGGAPINFQFHHQPFNYFADLAPGTPARAEHLKDGGVDGAEFIKAIDGGKLPAVSFYKPQGNLNEHAGYADVQSGDEHLVTLIHHLEKSPQWKHMLVVVTYDENGGFWDHVAPPKADRFGPGTRIPAFIVSPYAKRGFVDHSTYDTTSILRFITHRFDLPTLPGIKLRDEALAANHSPALGDLTGALSFGKKS